jgi:hypothetical protein
MLMPAAVLIVLVTYGLDQAALRRGDGYLLDPARVQQAVAESIDAQGLTEDLTEAPVVTMTTPDSVTVEIHLRAEHLFARSIPTTPRTTVVRGTATATVGRR